MLKEDNDEWQIASDFFPFPLSRKSFFTQKCNTNQLKNTDPVQVKNSMHWRR